MIIKFVTEKIVLLRCDVCSNEFTRYKSHVFKKSNENKQKFHFCPGTGLGKRSGGSNCKKIAMKSGGMLSIKIQDMFIEKYGVKRPLQLPSSVLKCRKTNIERYGVDNPRKRPDIKEKIEQTNLKKYGVKNPFQMEKARIGCSSRISRFKAFETKKRNGNLWKSIPEDRLYVVLCDIFNIKSVQRQKWVDKWPIDFYVTDIDTYIQYDSHWHGYDDLGSMRDILEVAECKNKHDVEIYKKMLSDISQNEYFAQNNIKLVRYIGTKSGLIDIDKVHKLLCLPIVMNTYIHAQIAHDIH